MAGTTRLIAGAAARWRAAVRAAIALVLAGMLAVPPAFADRLADTLAEPLAEPLADTPAAPLSAALRERVEALRDGHPLRAAGGVIAARRPIPRFYEARGFRPAWDDPARRHALVALVADSPSHGLEPADYQLDALRALIAPADDDPTIAAERDLLFTDALIRLAYHLRFGKVNPRELYADWSFSRSLGALDPVTALEALVAAEPLRAAVERYAPQLEAYARLRAALAEHRTIAAAGGWPPLAAGSTLRAGDRDARVAALRTRLRASGDDAAPMPSDPALFDDALASAVMAFQARHGLEPDGAVGRRTVAALNVAVTGRIDQIRVNLERLRWVAQDIAGDYLLVDIAGFDARLYLGHRLAWQSRIVVGRPYRKTPTFRAKLRYLVLNPDWTVPPTILREDVVPKVIRDHGYLAAHDMRVIGDTGQVISPDAIDWPRYRAGGFPYRIVQAPGPDNPLGQVKFMLPNPYAVYLHDTPARALFERAERAFSSGCIRLERPLELAVLLLDDPERDNLDTLREAIASGETRVVPIRRQVPVLVLYHTAAVDDGGTVTFRPDLYQRDAAVLTALASPFRFSPVGRSRAVPPS